MECDASIKVIFMYKDQGLNSSTAKSNEVELQTILMMLENAYNVTGKTEVQH